MGKSTQYRNWAITWKADEHTLETTSKNGLRLCTGNYEYLIFVGPKESPDTELESDHQHVMVHCETANISKRKAKEALVEYSNLAPQIVEDNVVYISKLYSNKMNYIAYCYKSLRENTMSKDDEIVKNVISEIKDTGIVPTSNSIKRKLIDNYGANAFNKRFCKITDTYLNETDVIDTRGNPCVDLNVEHNRINFLTQMMFYYTLLMETQVSTLCKPFADIPNMLLKDVTFLISLLPYFTKRIKGACDNIPGLYLYGVQAAGKSSMFNNCRYVKKIPTDASGVSRFRMDKMHTAFLLDDIETNYICNRENTSTLKQLCLGNDVEVKIMGNTQSVKGFVFITSNNEPPYLTKRIYVDEDNKTVDEINNDIIDNSWKRRFISCKFIKTCPYDYNSINYDDLKLRDIAARMFKNKYDKMQEVWSNNKDVLDKFKLYYNVVTEDYCIDEDGNKEFDELMDKSADIVNNVINELTVEKLMTASKKIKIVNNKDIVYDDDTNPYVDTDCNNSDKLCNNVDDCNVCDTGFD